MKMLKFDPKSMGFNLVIDSRRRTSMSGDYLLVTKHDGGKAALVLSLSEETGDNAAILFGDRCNIAFNEENGKICIYSGKARSIGKRYGKRYVISIGAEYRAVKRMFGEFKRLYFDAKVWAGGQAILLTPTGERD